jgi:hypothetical protein
MAIPSLVKSLEVEEEKVQLRTLDLIGMLASRGEWNWNRIAERLTCITEAEFREAITSSIPLLITKLGHKDISVRSAVAELVGKLVNYSEQRLVSITAKLTRILKSSFVKP